MNPAARGRGAWLGGELALDFPEERGTIQPDFGAVSVSSTGASQSEQARRYLVVRRQGALLLQALAHFLSSPGLLTFLLWDDIPRQFISHQ
jgi:hypothetical protein